MKPSPEKISSFGMSEHRGNALWDTVCFLGCTGECFTSRAVITRLVQDGWKQKTAELYFSRLVVWARHHPEEFSGPASHIEKVLGGYKLTDNPER